jgi:hypothetical protein
VNIHTLYYEYDSFTEKRKKEALENLFKIILKDINHSEPLIMSILYEATDLEVEDFFGTEGADI